jgi:Pyruvate/2-oxoacid:ferredoxin oxidoreductase delta subunit
MDIWGIDIWGITMERDVIKINEEKCNGCGVCVTDVLRALYRSLMVRHD